METREIQVRDELIDQTKKLLGLARGSLVRVAMNLSQLKLHFVGKQFGLMCESELGISESAASKMVTVAHTYLEEGGLAPEQLESVDMEKLYLARNIEGSPELKLETARTLTRAEIKQSKNDEMPHKGDFRSVCTVCWVSEESHN